MRNKQTDENFPVCAPCLSWLMSLAIYLPGAYVFLRLGILFGVPYVMFLYVD